MVEQTNNDVSSFIEAKAKELIKDEKERNDFLKPAFDGDELVQKLLANQISFLEIAKEFIKFYPLHFDSAGLWWAWNEREHKWVIKDEVDILNLITTALEYSGILNTATKSTCFNALRITARENKPKPVPVEWLQFNDKLINLKSGEEVKPSPDYFITSPVPWSLGESEDTPVIDGLLNQWAGVDAHKLLELMSYCLLRDYPIQRIIVLLGSGGNGKGSFLRLLRRLLGKDNITSTDLGKIGVNRFETAKLYNKLVCEIAETNVSLLKYTSTLKRLTGGDLIDAEFKNKNPFTFENHAKLIIATNSLPMTLDKTEGFYRRWLIIEFANKFTDGKEITNEIPEVEYSNLCRKLVRILKELLDRGSFTNEGNVDDRKNRYEYYSNPLKTFIEENYERVNESFVTKIEFNESFREFLNNNGYRSMTEIEINRGLTSLGLEVKTKRIGDSTSKVIIDLKEKEDVTNVTNVTSTPIQTTMCNNYIENPVTTVTPVTNIKEWIIKILTQYNDDLEKRNKANLTEILTFNLGVKPDEVNEVLIKMCKEGIIAEVKHEHYSLIQT